MTNILVVFGRKEARDRWLRRCIPNGTINIRDGVVELKNGVRFFTKVMDTHSIHQIEGMELSAVFEDDSFVPFAGWSETAAARVKG